MAQAPRDQNFVPAVLFESSTSAGTTITGKIDQATGRILTTAAGGSGTVTSVSVVSANGFAGTVATATTTPAITLSTTITGILSGNGTAISAASTTGSGAVVLANSPTFVDDITVGTAATSTGSILFKGLTSGTVTMKVADVAGTWTMTLPTTDGDSGQVLSTDGAGVCSWVSAGGVPTTITVANEATDTSCFLGFFTAATGDLGPKTNANLTFDSSTGIATFGQTIAGSITGNAGTVTVADAGGDTTTFVLLATDATGSLSPRTDAGLSYNATTNVLTSTGGFAGDITGNAATVTVADEAADTSCFVSFTTAATGSLGIKSNAGLTFNSSTGALTATSFVGSVTGNAATVTFANEATDTTCFIAFATAATGSLEPKTNTNMTFNSNTGVATFASTVLTTTDINGGTIDGTTIGATSATTIVGTTITANTGFMPDANDGAYLGQAGTAFADLFLAEGGVINWDSGDVTLTQTGNVLAVAGGDLRVATADVGTNADSVPTLSSTSTFTNKTLTSPTINTATIGGITQLAEGASIALDAAGSADGVYSGVTIAGTAGATLAFGDLVYLSSVDSRWELADADAATTADRMMGMCVLAAAADGSATRLLLMGTIRADAAFPALTIGSAVYVGETAGDIQVAIPTGADNVIRRVGYALTADEIYFNPSMDSQITVA